MHIGKPLTFDFPEPMRWALRLAGNAQFAKQAMNSPLLFAALYAVIAPKLLWPNAMQASLEELRHKRLLEDSYVQELKDLERKLNVSLPTEYILHYLESSSVLHVLTEAENLALLSATANRALARLESEKPSVLATNIARLVPVFKLTDAEVTMLTFIAAASIIPGMSLLAERALEDGFDGARRLSIMLGIPENHIANALLPSSLLLKSGMLRVSEKGQLPVIASTWRTKLLSPASNDEEFAALFLRQVQPEVSGATAPRIDPEDALVVKALLSEPRAQGAILFHGPASVDRKRMAVRLCLEAECFPYEVDYTDAAPEDYPSLCLAAQALLAKASQGPDTVKAVLLVDKATQVLPEKKTGGLLAWLYKDEDFSSEPAEDKLDFGQTLLKWPGHSIWLSASSGRINEEDCASFIYHVEIKPGTRKDRKLALEERIKGLSLSKEAQDEIISQAGLSERQIDTANQLATLLKDNGFAYEHTLRLAIKRSQKALNRRDTDGFKDCVTEYSLEYLNTAGRFKPAQIVSALERRPQGSLCFYGLPGTGKTQLAEYMAQQLDKPLLIKRASDLLSKWVGESERNIAEMFQEAEEEHALLLLDEADSFLRDRNRANHNWEVAQVNELLQHMERYRGIFIASTNLYRSLDPAALRRFTFKLEFRALTEEQRWEMFLNEAGLRGETSAFSEAQLAAWKDRLLFIRDLTPGDFATVKRQALLLGETLSPELWLDQLDQEAKARVAATEE